MRILILGASGFIGAWLRSSWAARHDVTGTSWQRAALGLLRLDLRDERALAAIASSGFDVVVHAAGLVELAAAEREPDLAWTLNVRSVEVVLEALAGSPGKLVYLSTDNAFDGTRPEYTEDDDPCPINVYGRTKVAAEERVLAGARHLVVRLPLVYGRSPVSDRFMARLSAPVTRAQTDVVCAPVYLPSTAEAIERLWDFSGLVHYGGPEVLTRFDLMRRVQAALELPTCVVPVRDEDMTSGYRRPKRLVMRSKRHGLLGPDVDTALRDLRGC